MVHLSHQTSRLNFSGNFSMPGIVEWISEKSTTMLGNLFDILRHSVTPRFEKTKYRHCYHAAQRSLSIPPTPTTSLCESSDWCSLPTIDTGQMVSLRASLRALRQIDVDPRSGSATAPSRARFPRGLSTWDQSKYQLHCHNDCITMPLANMEWWSGKYKILCMSFFFLRSGPFHGPSLASDFATQFFWQLFHTRDSGMDFGEIHYDDWQSLRPLNN
jgi:hypothetical protein